MNQKLKRTDTSRGSWDNKAQIGNSCRQKDHANHQFCGSKDVVHPEAESYKIIKQIADMKPNFNLAISLHSANEHKRNQIMDINKTNILLKLKEAQQYFYLQTGIKPTYEYILLKGFNDTMQDAKELIEFCSIIPSKVNLIEYNQVKDAPYERSTQKATNLFINILEKNNILVKLRRSRGEDIGAACGQLATQNQT